MHAFTTTPTKLLSASTKSILFSYDHNYVVYKRAESSLPTVEGSTSSTTKADGCLVCATTEPLCPSCPNGQECRLRAPSCNQCVEAYCAPLRSDNSGSTPVGAIVGGVVGGVAFLVFLAGLWYFFVFRKRNDYYDEKEGIYMGGSDSVRASGIELGGMANDGTGSLHENSYEAGLNDPNGGGGGGHNTDQGMNNLNNTANATLTSQGAAQLAGLMAASGISGSGGGVGGTLNSMRPPSAPVQRNKRLSSYESFTKPTIRAALLTKKKAAAGGGNNVTGAGGGISNSNSMNSRFNDSGSGLIYGLAQQNYLESSNRNSVATSISTTNASNILPIAYIPGVTVRPTKNNTRSIHIDLESLFSDLVTIENASIIGAESTNSKNNSQSNATMTAIKAQPRLVNVEKIDEEDESSEEDGGIQQLDDVDSALVGSSIDQGSSRNPGLIHIATKTQVTQVTRARELGHSHEFGSDDEDGDDELSDEDSDIGEITRATSLRRPRVQGIPIGVGVGFDKPPIRPVDRASMRSDDGSFVLDVEIDNDDRSPGTGTIGVSRSTRTTTGAEGSSVHSGERSPFDDP
ncbi:uncharacterized protein KQ657_000879 [Scheffersomyces spartinae]|uniref:Membrane anchor Opy2 N-terminal domain-containing protein n=1 Tax=Scheffersomyces spartinae TaxID=45513 RepID=A0A9P7V9D8_9ASCO|nr:uncharacterized protein KQ657_000879 [Scheffersomyces spartinae]KAG7193460.1 hypothetical protein KQ657_000879 [Scheffersomyces spartinae]